MVPHVHEEPRFVVVRVAGDGEHGLDDAEAAGVERGLGEVDKEDGRDAEGVDVRHRDVLVVAIGDVGVGLVPRGLEVGADEGEEIRAAVAAVPFVEVTGEGLLVVVESVVVVVSGRVIREDRVELEFFGCIRRAEAGVPVLLEGLEAT